MQDACPAHSRPRVSPLLSTKELRDLRRHTESFAKRKDGPVFWLDHVEALLNHIEAISNPTLPFAGGGKI
jgi:hypothetical protein